MEQSRENLDNFSKSVAYEGPGRTPVRSPVEQWIPAVGLSLVLSALAYSACALAKPSEPKGKPQVGESYRSLFPD